MMQCVSDPATPAMFVPQCVLTPLLVIWCMAYPCPYEPDCLCVLEGSWTGSNRVKLSSMHIPIKLQEMQSIIHKPNNQKTTVKYS